jgi:hypothetical protein
MSSFDDTEAIADTSTRKVSAPVQQSRDVDRVAILKAERNKPYNQDERASLEREIAVASKSAGIPYDGGGQAYTPQTQAPAQAAPPVAPQVPVDSFADTESQTAPVTQPQQEPGFLEKTGTALRGFGQGATAGLIQYPQAGLMSAVTGQPYSASLADLRAQNTQLAAEQPYQWYGGNVGGAVGLGALTAGGSLPVQAATAAGTGAVGGYTQNEDLSEAAQGAAYGGALGVAGGVLRAGMDKVAKSQIIDTINGLLKEKPEGWRQTLSNALGIPMRGDKPVQAATKLVDDLKSGTVKVADIVKNPVNPNTGIATNITDLAPSFKSYVPGVVQGVGEGIVGAGLGAGTNYLAGKPIDPYAAMVGGATMGLTHGGARALKDIGTTSIAKYATSPMGRYTAQQVNAPVVATQIMQPTINPQSAPDPFAETEGIDTRSSLRRLIDDINSVKPNKTPGRGVYRSDRSIGGW